MRARAVESARRRAREVAFRVVYQADVTTDCYAAVWRALRNEEHLSEDQAQLVSDLIAHLEAHGAEVDASITRAAERWSLPRLAATDRSVLRSATAELAARPGTPARVVLDEAIDIAKRFGSEASGGFVNGVLDQVARRLRPGEF
ncbi:MAG: transcription antitermination factor NusB [Candidatus Eisenbacteria bacterium]|nr:transcription antitermination factor NusB [Candidatus Eisenbacteria bacterium]